MKVLLIFISWPQFKKELFAKDKTIPLERSWEEDTWGSINSNEGRKYGSSGTYDTSSRRSYHRSRSSHHTSALLRCIFQNCRQTYWDKLTDNVKNNREHRGKKEIDSNYKLGTREWQFMPATSIILPTFVPADRSNYKSISVKLGNCIKTRAYWKQSVPWLTVANKMDPVNTLCVISGALELHSASLCSSDAKAKLYLCVIQLQRRVSRDVSLCNGRL